MKRAILLLLSVLITLLLFDSCIYIPPKGYTRGHHTYDEIIEFARSLDPNAIVSENYKDTFRDDLNREFREWDAVINGIECHVSSVGRMVFNSGVMAGEFAKQFFVIDTDYDYYLLEKLISERQPAWSMKNSDEAGRYNWNDVLTVETSCSEDRELTSDELETVWSNAFEIFSEYSSCPVRKTAYFSIAAPEVFYDGTLREQFVGMGQVSLSDFSEEGKAEFFEKYAESWDLLDSDLPFRND